MISLNGHSDKIMKKFFLSFFLCKITYLIKIFDIILPNLDSIPEVKNMAKNKQNRSQIKLKLLNNTN